MIVMERRPELDVYSESEAKLRLDRTGIRFYDLDQDRVRIVLTMHNDGEQCSSPTIIRVESAPFGAFVTWKPLTQILVPALQPGESRELSTEVVRPRPVSLGDFDRVPPRTLLTAIGSADQSLPADTFPGALLQWIGRKQSRHSATEQVGVNGLLAPDLWDWVGRGQPHWAGNINVFVGRQPVERHHAKALRVYPGRTNLAMFVVGSPGSSDAFAFELVGLAPDWKACLHDVRNNRALVVGDTDAPIEEAQWVQSNGLMMVLLATRPPANCSAGTLQVQVTRRGSEKVAIVEFDLDPNAQGPGCYSV